ncbi:YlcI/YnfO family protein [Agrobacterium rosae]|uniref:YlcI/YnfO family protein n=1 Tax=Agrobacterium rosae TaxID=1972867 RepID=A0AAW9FDA2_9HYPH|nr:YlcI/YnfO family protein [Agrobacterium rosae]MDX8303121.1 YlcI/YnfO family protein [Agrobacterium rosae]POO56401.1 prevent-host-death protein [Agrobacterium rosae]
MKSATMPSIRVTPDFREELESVLKDGETISSFMEDSILREIEIRKSQSEFIKRGLAAREEAKRTGVYYTTEDVLAMMRSKLEKAKVKAAKAG